MSFTSDRSLWTGSWVANAGIFLSSGTTLSERWDDRCVSTDLKNVTSSVTCWNEGGWTESIITDTLILVTAIMLSDLQSISVGTLRSGWAVLSVASTDVLDTTSRRIDNCK